MQAMTSRKYISNLNYIKLNETYDCPGIFSCLLKKSINAIEKINKIIFILQVLLKMQINGMFDCIELNAVLKYLGMNDEDFLHMCIIAGCDYLPNIRCIGLNKARKLVLQEADLMDALLKLKHVPEGYARKFFNAKAVFLHQTVIDVKTLKTVPLREWDVTEKPGPLQNLCGKYPFDSDCKG